MKIESHAAHFEQHDQLKAIQDKIQEMKHRARPEWSGDQASIRSKTKLQRQTHEISPQETAQSLAHVIKAGRNHALGDMHANLDMDRVRELLSPVA